MNAARQHGAPRRGRRRAWTAGTLVAVLAAVALSASGPAAYAKASLSSSRPPAVLQAALDRLVASGVPGAIVLERQGDRVMRAVSGVRDLRSGAPIRTDDRFRIASNTKSFVSTVVLQLVGEGRLRLTDSVERWVPGTVPGGAAITVRQLLNHTSGLYDYGQDPRLLTPYELDRGYFWPPRELIALANSHPPLFPPGAGFAYANTNYVLLGLIIEAVTHNDASAEVYRRVIWPLGLNNTSFPIRDPHLAGHHTRGYLTNLPPESGVPGGILDITTLSPSIAWTAGGIISTVTDLARFHRALFTGRVLRPTELRELTTTVPGTDYGLGVFRVDMPCEPAWGHNGSLPGYLSISVTSPDGARQAVVALNTDRILSEETMADISGALDTAFCGQSRPPGPSALPHRLPAPVPLRPVAPHGLALSDQQCLQDDRIGGQIC
jgi:D-alanyl-D-alanine carboxypeptidase